MNAGGSSRLCILFSYIELFCYVAVAYSSSFQGNNFITFCFGRHVAWSDVYKRTKQSTCVYETDEERRAEIWAFSSTH